MWLWDILRNISRKCSPSTSNKSVPSFFQGAIGVSCGMRDSFLLQFANSWHTMQVLVICSMSLLMFGQYTPSLANSWVFSMPWWDWWSLARMSARGLSGMRTCFPLKMMPSSTANSLWNDQKTHTSVGRPLMLSCHPLMMVSMIHGRISGYLISKLMLFPLWKVDQVYITAVNYHCCHLNAINSEIQLDCTLVLWIWQPRQSVCQGHNLSLAWRYLIVKS